MRRKWNRIAAATAGAIALTVSGIAAQATPVVPDPTEGPTEGGTTVTMPAPTGPSGFTQIGAGYSHALALTEGGQAYAWGNNDSGQLGNNRPGDSRTPVPVHMPEGVTFAQISVGANHSIALTEAGQAYAWGRNVLGRLGDGTTTDRAVPVPVVMPEGVTFTQVSAGGGHSLALTADGRAYAWGENSHGQLGNGKSGFSSTPIPVHMPEGVTFTQVSAGEYHSLAITPDGRAYAWGENTFGQLGNGNNYQFHTPIPVSMPSGAWFAQISTREYHSVAVTTDERAYAWGKGTEGQLGDNVYENDNVPIPVSMPSGARFLEATAGVGRSLALAAGGQAYAWGDNRYGALGNNTTDGTAAPTPVHMPEGVSFTQIDGGFYFSLALADSGRAYAWGWNAHGQLGDGTSMSSSRPVAVLLPEAEVTAVLFDGEPGTEIIQSGDGSVSAVTPAHDAGVVDVTVEWTLGGTAQPPIIYPDAFTYTASLTEGPEIGRVSGPDRYATNLALLKDTHAAGKPVFVATGVSFPDALTVGPAVTLEGGSLALSPTGKARADLISYLEDNVPSKIYLVGGQGALSATVENQMKAIAPTERIAGKDRYETATAIYSRFFAGTNLSEAFVATGENFPDALSASAAGGTLTSPVLLVRGTGKTSLPAPTVSSLQGEGVNTLYLVGGTGAISQTIEDELKNDGFTIERLSGPTRYGTNEAVNTHLGTEGISGWWVATGQNFPDALSTAVPAGGENQRLVLSKRTCLPRSAADWIKNAPDTAVTLVGGTGVLNSNVQALTPCN